VPELHPSEQLLADLYASFSKGDIEAVLGMCRDDIQFSVPGNAPFSGVYDKSGFIGMVGQVMQISGGTFGERPVLIVANDYHGIVVLDHWLERDGKRIEYRTDHIWGIEGGKLTSWQERPGNQEEFDRAWS